jgi:hypothetical protein
MQRERSGGTDTRHPRGKDFEREDRFEREDKPARGAASDTERSPDASSPGTRLSPRKPAGRRGESTRGKSQSSRAKGSGAKSPSTRGKRASTRSTKGRSRSTKGASRSGSRGRRASA